MIFQHAEMDEDVALAIVADEEAKTTRVFLLTRVNRESLPKHFSEVRGVDAVT